MTNLQHHSKGFLLSLWNDVRYRRFIYQGLLFVLIFGTGAYLVSNLFANIAERSIHTGFAFLKREAGFHIGESIIPFTAQDTYARAYLVGLLNTLRVSLLGIFLASILGIVIGFMRISHNFLVKKIASFYVETLRNVPLLLQLYFWYTAIITFLPSVKEAFKLLPGVYLSKSGLVFPSLISTTAYWAMFIALVVGLIVSFAISRIAKRRLDATGKRGHVLILSLLFIIGLPLVVWLLSGMPVNLSIPKIGRFNFSGGITITPEFLTLLIGLTTYTSAFIAENVRAGIQAVPRGQMEAALAVGLKRGHALRLVVLPQALRIIIPPTISQYLNLVKNSSLAVAIGYPDLVSVTNTSLNQTGQAIECIAIMMSIYLSISLSISAIMNWYNRLVALKGS